MNVYWCGVKVHMVYTTHVLTGGALGTMVSSPLLALLGGIVLHHVLDMVPHLDPGYYFPDLKKWKDKNLIIAVVVDLAIGTGVILALWHFQNLPNTVLWGALGSMLPDLIDNHPWSQATRRLPLLKQYHWFHHYFHWTATQKQVALGIATQVILIAISVIILV